MALCSSTESLLVGNVRNVVKDIMARWNPKSGLQLLPSWRREQLGWPMVAWRSRHSRLGSTEQVWDCGKDWDGKRNHVLDPWRRLALPDTVLVESEWFMVGFTPELAHLPRLLSNQRKGRTISTFRRGQQSDTELVELIVPSSS